MRTDLTPPLNRRSTLSRVSPGPPWTRSVCGVLLLLALAPLLALRPTQPAAVSAQPGAQAAAPANETAYVQYLANAGVLVVQGDVKVAFDPLFRVGFGTYRLLPEALRKSLFTGEPPFDGLDAIFVSHYHGDHFSAADVLRLMARQPELIVFAPKQATDAMRAVLRTEKDGPEPETVFSRVRTINLAVGDAPTTLKAGALRVDAVRIPHSGWPDRMQNVENIAYRVGLEGGSTAVHLGDADADLDHYSDDAAFWKERAIDVAFPPYWYFLSEDGNRILSERLAPALAIGVHLPIELEQPADRDQGLQGVRLFAEPGERIALP